MAIGKSQRPTTMGSLANESTARILARNINTSKHKDTTDKMQESFSKKWASFLIDYRQLDDSLPDECLPLEYTFSDWKRCCHPQRFKSVRRLPTMGRDSKM